MDYEDHHLRLLKHLTHYYLVVVVTFDSLAVEKYSFVVEEDAVVDGFVVVDEVVVVAIAVVVAAAIVVVDDVAVAEYMKVSSGSTLIHQHFAVVQA